MQRRLHSVLHDKIKNMWKYKKYMKVYEVCEVLGCITHRLSSPLGERRGAASEWCEGPYLRETEDLMWTEFTLGAAIWLRSELFVLFASHKTRFINSILGDATSIERSVERDTPPVVSWHRDVTLWTEFKKRRPARDKYDFSSKSPKILPNFKNFYSKTL